jgi:hypothetical protein
MLCVAHPFCTPPSLAHNSIAADAERAAAAAAAAAEGGGGDEGEGEASKEREEGEPPLGWAGDASLRAEMGNLRADIANGIFAAHRGEWCGAGGAGR